MTTEKMSAFTSGGAINIATDTLVAIRNGNTNVLLTPSSNASTNTFNVYDYGAKGDGLTYTTINTVSGSAVLTGHTFTAADVGKVITMQNAGSSVITTGDTATSTTISNIPSTASLIQGESVSGSGIPAGAYIIKIVDATTVQINVPTTTTLTGTAITFSQILTTTIISVAGGQATLNANCGVSRSNVTITLGTDDTAAIQAAVAAAASAAVHNGPSTVVLPEGIFVLTAPIVWATKVSLKGQGSHSSTLKWMSPSAMGAGNSAAIAGVSGGPSTPYTDCNFEDFGIDTISAITTFPGTYEEKCIQMVYCLRCNWRNLYLRDSPKTALGVDYLIDCSITDCLIKGSGRLITLAAGLQSGSGISWETGMGGTYKESVLIANNIIVDAIGPAIAPSMVNGTQNTAANPANAVISDNFIYNSQPTSAGGIIDGGMNGCTITGNYVYSSVATTAGIGIGAKAVAAYTCGTNGTISGNIIDGWLNNIELISINSASTETPSLYTVIGNKCLNATNNGILLREINGLTVNRVVITDNTVDNSFAAGIKIWNAQGTSAAIMEGLQISNNILSNNGNGTATDNEKSGLYVIGPCTGMNIQGNYMLDDSTSTQKYGMTLGAGQTISNTLIANNHCKNNTTKGLNLLGTVTGQIVDNYGYNPVGPATVTPGASPWTYTNGASPATLYISGGTVSSITKNGFTLAAATGTQITMSPNDAIIVTYSVAPTVINDIG